MTDSKKRMPMKRAPKIPTLAEGIVIQMQQLDNNLKLLDDDYRTKRNTLVEKKNLVFTTALQAMDLHGTYRLNAQYQLEEVAGAQVPELAAPLNKLGS